MPANARGRSATPRRRAAASIAAGIVRSCRSTTAGSASCRPTSCWPTSARRSPPAPQHITFGDPDFFNGPTHAMRDRARRCTREFPTVTYDVTIKVEHLLQHRDAAAAPARHRLRVRDQRGRVGRRRGAGEAREGAHARRLRRGRRALRAAGSTLAPTFVAFTPWTTLDGYCDLLDDDRAPRSGRHVAPIQFAIRLLIPEGSRLLELADMRARVERFDAGTLTHRLAPRGSAGRRAAAASSTRSSASRLNAPRDELFARICGRCAHARGRRCRRRATRAAAVARRPCRI